MGATCALGFRRAQPGRLGALRALRKAKEEAAGPHGGIFLEGFRVGGVWGFGFSSLGLRRLGSTVTVFKLKGLGGWGVMVYRV